jgi:hypothetical protein
MKDEKPKSVRLPAALMARVVERTKKTKRTAPKEVEAMVELGLKHSK